MQEILSTNSEDSELIPGDDTSKELEELYAVFQQLIRDRRFQNNRFLEKEDALAVIDLAETCEMYQKNNFKAAGVCYNNIANLQFKNNKYALAADNYLNAVKLSDKCLDGFFSEKGGKKEIDAAERLYFQCVKANRTYQYTICKYKEVRYHQKEPDTDTWSQIDLLLRASLELYSTLVDPDTKKHIYVDLIIKLMILRGFVNT